MRIIHIEVEKDDDANVIESFIIDYLYEDHTGEIVMTTREEE